MLSTPINRYWKCACQKVLGVLIGQTNQKLLRINWNGASKTALGVLTWDGLSRVPNCVTQDMPRDNGLHQFQTVSDCSCFLGILHHTRTHLSLQTPVLVCISCNSQSEQSSWYQLYNNQQVPHSFCIVHLSAILSLKQSKLTPGVPHKLILGKYGNRFVKHIQQKD